MYPVPRLQWSRSEFFLLILVLFATLFLREGLRLYWVADGVDDLTAKRVATLPMFALQLLMVAPLLHRHRLFFARILSPRVLSIRLVLTCVAIALMCRVASWSLRLAIASSGLHGDGEPRTPEALSLVFACPTPGTLLLAFVSGAVLTGFVEELLHRGGIQSLLQGLSPALALPGSALVFTLMHTTAGWPVVFLMGLLLAYLFRTAGSLWPGIIVHLSYNAFAIVDWYCVQGRWQPGADSGPGLSVAFAAVTLIVAATVLWLLKAHRIRALTSP